MVEPCLVSEQFVLRQIYMYVSGQALKEMSKILVKYSNNRRLSNISIARLKVMKTYVAPKFRKTLAFRETLCNFVLQMLYYFSSKHLRASRNSDSVGLPFCPSRGREGRTQR